jgi:hypothetical protein
VYPTNQTLAFLTTALVAAGALGSGCVNDDSGVVQVARFDAGAGGDAGVAPPIPDAGADVPAPRDGGGPVGLVDSGMPIAPPCEGFTAPVTLSVEDAFENGSSSLTGGWCVRGVAAWWSIRPNAGSNVLALSIPSGSEAPISYVERRFMVANRLTCSVDVMYTQSGASKGALVEFSDVNLASLGFFPATGGLEIYSLQPVVAPHTVNDGMSIPAKLQPGRWQRLTFSHDRAMHVATVNVGSAIDSQNQRDVGDLGSQVRVRLGSSYRPKDLNSDYQVLYDNFSCSAQ